jgi:hypothetical protein
VEKRVCSDPSGLRATQSHFVDPLSAIKIIIDVKIRVAF